METFEFFLSQNQSCYVVWLRLINCTDLFGHFLACICCCRGRCGLWGPRHEFTGCQSLVIFVIVAAVVVIVAAVAFVFAQFCGCFGFPGPWVVVDVAVCHSCYCCLCHHCNFVLVLVPDDQRSKLFYWRARLCRLFW